MFCRKFGWPSMKGLKIKVRRLKLFGRSLNFWRICHVLTSTRKQGGNWYQLAIGEEGAQLFVKSTIFILHFAPSLRFTLSLQSAFYTLSAFYRWSAVSSLQSAVCVLHWPVYIHLKWFIARSDRIKNRQVQKSDRINSDRQSGSDQLGSNKKIIKK